jgi:hypothetical protein
MRVAFDLAEKRSILVARIVLNYVSDGMLVATLRMHPSIMTEERAKSIQGEVPRAVGVGSESIKHA